MKSRIVVAAIFRFISRMMTLTMLAQLLALGRFLHGSDSTAQLI